MFFFFFSFWFFKTRFLSSYGVWSLSWNSLCSPDWPWTHIDSSAHTFQVLALKVCTTTAWLRYLSYPEQDHVPGIAMHSMRCALLPQLVVKKIPHRQNTWEENSKTEQDTSLHVNFTNTSTQAITLILLSVFRLVVKSQDSINITV